MKTRRWIVRGIAIYIAIILIVAVGLALLSVGARNRLDEALGDRLEGVGMTTAHFLGEQYGDSLLVWSVEDSPSLELLWLSTRLERIQRDNQLAEITLCDPDGQVLISTSGLLTEGEENVFWQLDPAGIDLAKDGFAAVSPLYRRGDITQKSAHAPVFSSGGLVSGILTVEGSAGFFHTLGRLRQGALLTGTVVLVLLTLLGLLLLRMQRLADQYRASVHQQENLATMGRMTAGIAHEIRNPLGIIRGAGQHMARRLEEAGLEDEISEFIPAEVDRLDRILSGYLAFGSDTAAETESVDLLTLCRRMAGVMRSELEPAGIGIEIESGGGEVRVEGDPRRLQQVLLNLLLNARNAMPNGGVIHMDVHESDGQGVVRVRDEGVGLKGASAEQLFAPFWTTRDKGSGLGLAMAGRIVESHGGALDLQDNAEGPGAVAILRLPLLED